MKVRISDKYLVEIDNYNFTLFENRLNKANKVVPYRVGYFMNMKAVLTKIVALESYVENGDLTFEEYLDHLNTVDEKLIELVDKLFIERKLTRKEMRDNE